jgi:hypothetical protein
MGMATDLIWWARDRVLGHRARRVRWHVFEDSAQPVDDVIVVHFISRHLRRVVVAGVRTLGCHGPSAAAPFAS